jgi:hypothetical protein
MDFSPLPDVLHSHARLVTFPNLALPRYREACLTLLRSVNNESEVLCVLQIIFAHLGVTYRDAGLQEELRLVISQRECLREALLKYQPSGLNDSEPWFFALGIASSNSLLGIKDRLLREFQNVVDDPNGFFAGNLLSHAAAIFNAAYTILRMGVKDAFFPVIDYMLGQNLDDLSRGLVSKDLVDCFAENSRMFLSALDDERYQKVDQAKIRKLRGHVLRMR